MQTRDQTATNSVLDCYTMHKTVKPYRVLLRLHHHRRTAGKIILEFYGIMCQFNLTYTGFPYAVLLGGIAYIFTADDIHLYL